MQRWVRKLHRWVGLAVVLQLVAWTVGGLYFSIIPIETIRGEHLVAAPAALDAGMLAAAVPPSSIEGLPELGPIAALTLVSREGRPFYRAEIGAGIILFDALTGARAPAITADDAARLARDALQERPEVVGVTRLEVVPRGHEYRGKPLPAYQVTFDHGSGVRVYVGEATGEITTKRTDAWRLFDFLWMLHIMDYQDRDDFNHPVLTLVASVALFVLLSGLLLWWQSTPLRRRRRTA